MASTAATDTRNPAAIWAACERFLSGHGTHRVKDTLQDLADAVTGDELPDHYGMGEIVGSFERELATLLGKESAVFLPTGTMTQQVALRIWCDRTGPRTVGFHPTCHLEIHEQKAYQLLHGLHARLIGDTESVIALADLEDLAEPLGALLLELPQREIGGQLPSWEDLQSQLAWAHERGVPVHMDGARLWESGPFYGRPYDEIASGFDSVYVSFYKGLGGLGGAALAGPSDFIRQARVWARRHGGNLFQFFPYVVAARTQLARRLDRFPAYRARALTIAAALDAIDGIRIKPNPPQTNMMHVYLEGDPDRLLDTSLRIAEEERVAVFRYLRPSGVPRYSMFELTIGDAADALTDEEIEGYFRRVMSTDAS